MTRAEIAGLIAARGARVFGGREEGLLPGDMCGRRILQGRNEGVPVFERSAVIVLDALVPALAADGPLARERRSRALRETEAGKCDVDAAVGEVLAVT